MFAPRLGHQVDSHWLSGTILAGSLMMPCVPAIAQSTASAATTPSVVVTEEAQEEVQEAAAAFRSVLDARRVPELALDRAHAVAVFDDLVRGAFIVGGAGGDGVLVHRLPDGEWSAPVFLDMAGGSLGAQIGGSRTDAVLLFMEPSALDALRDGHLEFGTSFRAVAGPATVDAETLSTSTRDHVLVYAHEEGLFAGAALTGVRVSIDRDLTRAVYGTVTGPLTDPEPAPRGLTDLAEAIATPSFETDTEQ